MSSKSLNTAMVIGNLARDPEMRYTPNGKAVTSFTVVTNRSWTTEGGEPHDEAEFHGIVAWGKLGELCNQLLKKGAKAFIQGRLQTRTWDDQQGVKHYKTEIVAEDMLVLSPRQTDASAPATSTEAEPPPEAADAPKAPEAPTNLPTGAEDVNLDDEKKGMPF